MATLLAAYILNEANGATSLADATNNGHTATVTDASGVTFETGAQAGSYGLRFSSNGINNRAEIAATGLEPTASNGGVAIMIWFKAAVSTSNSTGIFTKARTFDSTRCGAYIDMGNNGALFMLARWKNDLHYGWYSSNFNDNAWHHMAIADNDDEWAFYIDGVKVDGASRFFNNSTSPTWEGFPWTIGYNTEGQTLGESNNNVVYSSPRIFSGMLTQTEVQTWMSTPVTQRSGKVKYWDGSAWVAHPLKYWDGSTWTAHKAKGYDGTGWIEGK